MNIFKEEKSRYLLILTLTASFIFLSLESFSFNLFPVVDREILAEEKDIVKVYEVNFGNNISPGKLKKISGEIRKTLAKNNRIHIIISVQTDPIGDSETNRRVGINFSNWIGQSLVKWGVPRDRLAITEPEEDKGFLMRDSPDFRKRQICRIALLDKNDLFSKFGLGSYGADSKKVESTITILSPLMKETDKGFHILKGIANRFITVLAVTVNNSTKTISVFSGKFETPISLIPGNNVISISGKGPGKMFSKTSFNITYNPPNPSIVIETPKDGESVDISRSPTVVVRGRIKSRKNIVSAFLIHNGFPRNLRIEEDGTFRQKAVILSDKDTFKVEVINFDGYSGVSKEHRVSSNGISRQHMTVILNWQTDGVDLDLVVQDMYGYRTSFESPDRFRSHRSIPEGNLEVDDKDGFGPEIFTITEQKDNSYDIYVKYYHGKRDTQAYLTVILFPDITPKRIVKIFGPFKFRPSQDEIFITRVQMPQGLFLQESHQAEVR